MNVQRDCHIVVFKLTSPEHSFRCEEWECVAKVELHLAPKLGEGACPRPVAPQNTRLDDVVNQLEVL